METERILKRLDALIAAGATLLSSSDYNTKYINYVTVKFANEGRFLQWWTSCTTLLNAFPDDYIYAAEYDGHCKSSEFNCIELGIGILCAAKEDIEHGVLQQFRELISAEVFDDFLDMAEHLLENEYKDPAASLIGAVLENNLRRLCEENGIVVSNDDNISSLNQKLFQKPVYGKPQMTQVAHWQSIRNSADHGKFDEYNAETVKNMLEGVRNFLAA